MIGINLKRSWVHKMIDVNEISKMAYNIAEKRIISVQMVMVINYEKNKWKEI